VDMAILDTIYVGFDGTGGQIIKSQELFFSEKQYLFWIGNRTFNMDMMNSLGLSEISITRNICPTILAQKIAIYFFLDLVAKQALTLLPRYLTIWF